MPAPESYRNWKNHVRDEAKSCSDRPDEAWACSLAPVKSLNRSFKIQGSFPRWIQSYQQRSHAQPAEILPQGFWTTKSSNPEKVSKLGDDMSCSCLRTTSEHQKKQPLHGWRSSGCCQSRWHGPGLEKICQQVGCYSSMATTPEDAVLRDILLRQIRPSQLLKYDIEAFDRASEKAYETSYGFLHQSMKNLIDRERLRENRNRIAEKNKAGGPKDTKAAPAKGDGHGNPSKKGSPSRGRSQDRSKGDKVCYKFQKGQCDKGKKCPFKHVKDDKARTQSPKRNRTCSPSKGKKDDVRGRPHACTTNAFTSAMTKPLPPPRTPRGRILRLQRRRGRNSMLHHVWSAPTQSLHASQRNSRG